MDKNIHNFTLVRPKEMRQRFTEFVMQNQSLALDEPDLSYNYSEGFGNTDSIAAYHNQNDRKLSTSKKSTKLPLLP